MSNVSSQAGHSAKVHGADYGNRKEHEMAREVNSVFIGKLRALGHSVEDDTDESGVTASGVVNNQIRNVNSRREDVAFIPPKCFKRARSRSRSPLLFK